MARSSYVGYAVCYAIAGTGGGGSEYVVYMARTVCSTRAGVDISVVVRGRPACYCYWSDGRGCVLPAATRTRQTDRQASTSLLSDGH